MLAHCSLHITHCTLLIARHPLLIAHHPLLVARHPLLVARHPLLIARHALHITHCISRTAPCQWPITNWLITRCAGVHGVLVCALCWCAVLVCAGDCLGLCYIGVPP